MEIKLKENYTTKDLEEFDKKVKMKPLTVDSIFKAIFTKHLNITKKLLISVLELNVKEEDCKVKIISPELINKNKNEHSKYLDFNVCINDILYINVELLRIKNLFKNVESYDEFSNKKVIQLNLNVFEKSYLFGSDIVVPYSLRGKTPFVDHVIIQINYCEYYKNLYYNEHEKGNKVILLAMLTSTTFVELDKYLQELVDDNERMNFMKDMIIFSMDEAKRCL